MTQRPVEDSPVRHGTNSNESVAAPSELAKRLQSFRKAHWTHWTTEENQLVVDCFHALVAPVAAHTALLIEARDALLEAARTYAMRYAQDEADENGPEFTGCSEQQAIDARALFAAIAKLDAALSGEQS